jgi:zinc protease
MKRLAAGLSLFAALAGAAVFGQREAFRRVPPPAEPLLELRLPLIDSIVLNNGLSLAVIRRENAGLTVIQLLLFAGEAYSPSSEPGIATAAANVFGRTTQLLTPSAVEDRLGDIGGTLSVRVRPDYILFTYRFLTEFFEPALDLLGQMILQPSPSEADLNDVKFSETIDFVELDRNPESVAPRHLIRVLFQGHPYGNAAFSRDAIRNWSIRDVNAFTSALYRPNNAHMVVGGDLNLNEAARKISHVLGGSLWPSKDLPASPLRPAQAPDRERICLIDVPRSQECMIALGTVIPTPALQDRYALNVLSQVLGGTPASRLFMNLRESKNYAYYASCDTDFLLAGGVLSIRAKVKPESVVASVREIQRELALLAREPLPAEDLEQAKAYLINHFPLQVESLDLLTERAVVNEARDEGDDFWNQTYRQIQLVSAERVFDAARKILLQPFVIVVAGDKNLLSSRMNAFDAVEVYDNLGRLQYTTSRDKKGAQNEAR